MKGTLSVCSLQYPQISRIVPGILWMLKKYFLINEKMTLKCSYMYTENICD